MQKREKENKQSSTNGQAAAVKRPKFNKDKFRKFMLGTKERQGFLKVSGLTVLVLYT